MKLNEVVPGKIKPRLLVFLALSVTYLSVNIYLSTRLWYWWDEWTILRSQDSQFIGLLEGHFGNFFPLGRLVFWVETQVFGNFYTGLVVVNSLLVLFTCYMVYELVIRSSSRGAHSWIPVLMGLVTYATASGMIFDVIWGFQVAWLLSIFFAVLGPYLVLRKNLNPRFSLFFLGASWLSFNSNFLSVVLLYLALMYLNDVRPLNLKWRYIYLSFATAAALFTLIGLSIARLNPSVEPQARDSGVSLFSTPGELASAASEALSGSLLWLLTPIGGVLGHRPDLFQELGPTLAASPRLLLLLAIVVSIIVIATSGKLNWRSLSRPVAFLLPLTVVMVLVSARGQGDFETTFNLRYAPSVLLPAVIFWGVLSIQKFNQEKTLSRLLQYLFALLLSATAAIGTVSFLSQNPDSVIVFGRSDQLEQLELLKNCETNGLTGIEPAPFQSFTPNDFCELFNQLD